MQAKPVTGPSSTLRNLSYCSYGQTYQIREPRSQPLTPMYLSALSLSVTPLELRQSVLTLSQASCTAQRRWPRNRLSCQVLLRTVRSFFRVFITRCRRCACIHKHLKDTDSQLRKDRGLPNSVHVIRRDAVHIEYMPGTRRVWCWTRRLYRQTEDLLEYRQSD